MKTNKLIKILILSVILISCSSDNDDSPPPPPPNASSFASVNELKESLKPDAYVVTDVDPTQSFTINGPDGVQINCQENKILDSNGNVVTSPVDIALTEYLTPDKMILGNAQTTSNGQLLVTGGSFELDITDSSGNSLNVAPGSGCYCTFEVQTDPGSYGPQMLPYRGTRTTTNGDDTVNWDLGSMEGGVQGGNDQTSIFGSWGLDVGLTNCDVLYNMSQNNPTHFEVTLSDVTAYSSSSTTVWMFIEDFPSVVNITSINSTPAHETYQNMVPMGLNATLIGIHIDDDDYLRFGSTSITVAGDDSFNIDIDYGTEAALQALVESLTN
jgi:hypothetical protein